MVSISRSEIHIEDCMVQFENKAKLLRESSYITSRTAPIWVPCVTGLDVGKGKGITDHEVTLYFV